jgi:energy-coupling factor transporter ATP-binding protein EcfA2
MGGMCLGMSREEIEKKLDWIIDFSELRDVIDQPFKTYSSGMQARLTFSTAVSVDPDVFIIDEALAAGDMLFQEKCFRRIREIVDNGATVLFVTHSLGLVYEFCDSCLLLSQGSLVLQDEPRLVGYEYEKILAEDRQAQSANAPTVRLSVSSSTEKSIANKTEMLRDEDREHDESLKAEILSYELLNEQDVPVRTIVYGDTYLIRMKVVCHSDVDSMSLSFRIEQPSGLVVYGLSTIYSGKKIRGCRGKIVCVDFTLPCFLQAGNYLLGGGVAEMLGDAKFNVLHIVRGAVEFEVCGQIQFQGVADLQSEVKKISTQHAELNGDQG